MITFSFSYPSKQFVLIRFIVGLYLGLHFLLLIPYGKEVFSSQGMLPDIRSNLTYGYFPSILNLWDSPSFIAIFLVTLAISGFCLSLGWLRSSTAIFLWYGWACLFHRNNLIQTPAIFYVGWMLLAMALIPRGEKTNPDWKFPSLIYWGAWWILALGYTVSGLDKLHNSPSWITGDSISLILNTPLSPSGWTKKLILSLPPMVLKISTWSLLFLEILFLPLSFFRRTRQWIWSAMTGVHLMLMVLMNFPDLSFEMLLFHFFVYDASWKWGVQVGSCKKGSGLKIRQPEAF